MALFRVKGLGLGLYWAFKGLNIRIPIISPIKGPIKGRGFINQGLGW